MEAVAKHLGALALALGIIVPARAEADDGGPGSASRTRPMFHPDGPESLRWRASVGALLDVLPTHVVESELRQVPQLTGAFRFGLPVGFSTDARLRGNVIGNEASLGVAWSYAVGDFAFSVMDHQGIWFGALGVQGFDASGWGLTNAPGASVGLPWKHLRFSFTAELLVNFAQHTTLGDSSTRSRQKLTFAGVSGIFVVETLLDAGGAIYFGAGLLRTQADYQAWVAFSDERARWSYPRFLGGYVF